MRLVLVAAYCENQCFLYRNCKTDWDGAFVRMILTNSEISATIYYGENNQEFTKQHVLCEPNIFTQESNDGYQDKIKEFTICTDFFN